MPMHIIPNNDEREHVARADCWCDPEVLWLDPDTGMPWGNADAAPMVVHNSADCREVVEPLLDGQPIEPGKDWHWVVVDA